MSDKKLKSFQSPEWFRLDNAGILFPGQNTRNWSNLFRVSIELKEEIDPVILKQALENIMPRFPGFNVRLRKGLFWYYLEKNPVKSPSVAPDVKNPCYRMNFKESERFLFRVYYHGNHIAVDLFHAVSDGYGNSRFVCTLAAEYLRLKGNSIPHGGFVKNISEPAPKEELLDDFHKYATSKAKANITDKHVYHPDGVKMPKHMVNMTCGIMSFKEVHALAKAKGVTVTEFFAAIMLDIHLRKQLRENRKQKEVSVQIPINLRNIYPSATMRNFSICLMVKVDPTYGEYTFDELLTQVAYQLRLARDEKKINATISKHVRIEKNPALKLMPLVVKNVALAVATMVGAEQTTTVYLSNLGEITLPEEMVPFVEKALFVPCAGMRTAARCGVVSFNDKLVFTMANSFKENDIEREFFTTLVKMGVHVKIQSNRE